MISTIAELCDHLQTALEIEHSTIPPYLCALWSLEPGRNTAAARSIREVVMQEMLHMTLVANVLNGLGGRPAIHTPGFLPNYPTYLPHSDDRFLVPLEPFSENALQTFRKIELPATDCAPPEPDRYHTIAQFYEAIRDALVRLAKPKSVWIGNRDHQVGPDRYYYGSGGDAIVVDNFASAVQAVDVIIFQGEGIDLTVWDAGTRRPTEDHELAHYFRFDELYSGHRYIESDTPASGPTGEPLLVDFDAVLPMRPNPKAEHYPPGSELRAMTDECSRTYTTLLQQLQNAFTGNPSSLVNSVITMKQLEYRAIALMNVPLGDGSNAGPAFQWRLS
jgi:hypothetical protein